MAPHCISKQETSLLGGPRGPNTFGFHGKHFCRLHREIRIKLSDRTPKICTHQLFWDGFRRFFKTSCYIPALNFTGQAIEVSSGRKENRNFFCLFLWGTSWPRKEKKKEKKKEPTAAALLFRPRSPSFSSPRRRARVWSDSSGPCGLALTWGVCGAVGQAGVVGPRWGKGGWNCQQRRKVDMTHEPVVSPQPENRAGEPVRACACANARTQALK